MRKLFLIAILFFVLPAGAADRVKVGFVSTLSGPNAAIGGDIRDGFHLGLKLGGGKLGGLPAEGLIGDDQLKPENAHQLVGRHLRLDKEDFITGTRFSNIVVANSPHVVAARPQALYVFLPGGMGVNFIKQFVAAGVSQDIQLIVPLWGSDQDIIRAVGDPMLGLFSVGRWSIDPDNAANRKFVAAFEAEYKRLPTGYAASGYDTALLVDSAVRKVKGRIENKDALRAALRAADFKSVRGDFKFNANQFPVQNYYLQLIGKGGDGRLVHKTIGTLLTNRGDAYVEQCKMK